MMRSTVLALALLQLAGCSCRKPISAYCKDNPCDLASVEEQMLSHAEAGWIRGGCSDQRGGNCPDGRIWIFRGDHCATSSYFHKDGSLEYLETGCTEDLQRYGFLFECDRSTTTRDFCAEGRKRVKFKHLQMSFDAPVPVVVNGEPIKVMYGRNERALMLGKHVLSLDGHPLELEVIEKPSTLAIELRVVSSDPALTLSFGGGQASPLLVRDCTSPCSYQVSFPGRDAGVHLGFTPSYGQTDGGPPPRKFGENNSY